MVLDFVRETFEEHREDCFLFTKSLHNAYLQCFHWKPITTHWMNCISIPHSKDAVCVTWKSQCSSKCFFHIVISSSMTRSFFKIMGSSFVQRNVSYSVVLKILEVLFMKFKWHWPKNLRVHSLSRKVYYWQSVSSMDKINGNLILALMTLIYVWQDISFFMYQSIFDDF